MSTTEIIALIATCIGVISFALVIVILYRNYIRKAVSETSNGLRDIELIDTIIYENEPKVKRRNKAISASKTVVYYVFLVLAIPFLAFAIYSRITNGVVMIGDSSAMVVASGSMSEKNVSNDYLTTYSLNDQFYTYDMIALKKVDESSLRVYDVIAYRNDKNVNIIHRIISIEVIDGENRYLTRGDANNASDTYMPRYDDIIGKYYGKRIPVIGIFISFLQSYSGIVTIVSIVFCLYSIDHQNRKLFNAEDDRKEVLSKVFDTSLMNEDTYKEMASDSEQRIYYKGYCYKFKEEGFISKNEMSEEEKKEFSSNEEAMKITKDGEKEKKTFFSFIRKNKTSNHDKGGEEDEKQDN